MNQRNNYLQYIVLGILCLAVLAGIYWQGPAVHRATMLHLHGGTSAASGSAVTISAERFARLEKEAAAGRRLQQELNTSTATSSGEIVSRIGTSTPPLRASVTGRPPQSSYDTFVLDVGISDNVRPGAAVWWPAGVYLGEVVNVRERSSVVELVTSEGVQHAAFVAGIPIQTEGRGGGELYAEIPQDFDVSVGDTVMSDVYELPIGIVAEIRELTTSNQRALHITRFISSAIIEHVYVE